MKDQTSSIDVHPRINILPGLQSTCFRMTHFVGQAVAINHFAYFACLCIVCMYVVPTTLLVLPGGLELGFPTYPILGVVAEWSMVLIPVPWPLMV